MKKIISLLMFFIVLFSMSFVLESCDNFDSYNDVYIYDILNRSEMNISDDYDRVKLRIHSGKYNCVGDFRLLLNDEEIFNSKKYNYCIPKRKRLFTRILSKKEESSILKLELLENNSSVTRLERDVITIEDRINRGVQPFTCERINKYYDNIEINEAANTICKGNTIMLFKQNGEIGNGYVDSNVDSLTVDEFKSNKYDYNGNMFGYMCITSKEKCELISSNLSINSYNDLYNVYLGTYRDDNVDCVDKVITSKKNYIYINLININSSDQNYKISYSLEYRYLKHIEAGKIIGTSDWVEDGNKIEYLQNIKPYEDINYYDVSYIEINNTPSYKEIRLKLHISRY